MKCPEHELLRQYVNSEIDGQLSTQIRIHLSTCEQCSAETNKLRADLQSSDNSLNKQSKVTSFSEAELPERYESLGEIGRGGMGLILRVHDHNLNRTLALKTLVPKGISEEGLKRFEREARITGSLQHSWDSTCCRVRTDPGGVPFLYNETHRRRKFWYDFATAKLVE